MKKILVIAGALLALTAGMASATGVNLFWNDCSPAGGGLGVQNQSNLCTANTGAQTLIASIVTAGEVSQCVGVEGVIDLQTNQPALSSWWQMRSPAGCRPTSASTGFAFGPSSCLDPWAGQCLGGMDYAPGFGGPNRARIRSAGAQPISTAGPLDPNAEYYMFFIKIDRVKSTGTGNCPGCLDAACFVLNSIKITQPTGNAGGDPTYSNADQSQFATYNGAAGLAQCAATPTQNRTWGSVKSLYR